MHPVINQAIAAERRRDMEQDAAASQRARQIHRSQRARQARGPWPFVRVARVRRIARA
jgi:hypothetical protein